MLDALLIALIVVAALACPVTMLRGRRGVGPGCRRPGWSRGRTSSESLERLRARERELARRIEDLERSEPLPR